MNIRYYVVITQKGSVVDRVNTEEEAKASVAMWTAFGFVGMTYQAIPGK